MVNPLLERAPPRAFAERGQIIEKEEELELFPRFSEAVGGDLQRLAGESMPAGWRQSPVAIRLAFGWADTEHDVPVLEGHAAADVPAICQRCLEPFELTLETDLRLLFTGPGRSVDESLDYEVWELEDTTLLRPLDVVDEALVMAMPLAGMHASEADCGPLAAKAATEKQAQVRPFADLRAQMRNRD